MQVESRYQAFLCSRLCFTPNSRTSPRPGLGAFVSKATPAGTLNRVSQSLPVLCKALQVFLQQPSDMTGHGHGFEARWAVMLLEREASFFGWEPNIERGSYF